MPNGTSIWVRVNDDDEGPQDTGFGDSVSRQLGDLPTTLETVTQSVRSGLRRAAPDEVTLEFGIEIAVKSGKLVSVVTEAGGKATLKVTATWRKGEPEVDIAAQAPGKTPEEGTTQHETFGHLDFQHRLQRTPLLGTARDTTGRSGRRHGHRRRRVRGAAPTRPVEVRQLRPERLAGRPALRVPRTGPNESPARGTSASARSSASKT
ncbi:CU044_2847 family protein [Streptomyces chryseus]